MPTLPAARNLNGEFGGITAGINQLTGARYDDARQFDDAWTQHNTGIYGRALLGNDYDVSGGVAGLMRQGWAAANPQLNAYTQGLSGMLGQYRYDPTGYAAVDATAANAGPAAQAQAQNARFRSAGPSYDAGLFQAQAAQAAQQRAGGGPLLAQLQGDAMRSIGGVSPLQMRQQQISMGLLGGSGGDLSAQDLRNVQQDTRGAYAARGLYDSNQAIGAEIMNSDSARRNRLMQNLGIAQGVDAAGQQQIGATRQFALGVQNQGQNLSQFNAAQGNQLNQYNAGLLTNTAQFNAGQGNLVGTFNAGQRNQMAQYNAGQANQMGQFNAGLQAQNSQYNTGQQNQMGQYNAGLLQQANLYNAGSNNQAQQYNVGTVNQAGQFNAQMGQQGAFGMGQFLQQQAINPYGVAGQLQGGTPDYTAGALGYGNDAYNTNYNSQMARYMGAQNNSAGLWSGILGAVGTVGGAIVGGPIGASIGGALGKGIGGAVGGRRDNGLSYV